MLPFPAPSPPVVRAPEISRPGLDWLNVEKPLSLSDLNGKLVLLDFWTFCCINCIHMLPILKKVEDAFPNEVAVIGVHSPKFEAERDIRNVKQAVARYGIIHPVIHDPDKVLWKQFDVHAWPTLVFIDPHGYVIGTSAGEPEALHLLNAVRDSLERFDEQGSLKPAPLLLMQEIAPPSALRYPGKIKPLPGAEKCWLVADAGHNQIVVFDDSGAEIQRYGSGQKGGMDGAAALASFNEPQGLIADAKAIYVADTGNHALRRIDRATGDVTTLSGNGTRGMLLLNKFEPAKGRALASPWDLEIRGGILFFANAGTHQIGALDLESGQLRLIAGSGSEDLFDADVLSARLAQPSALAFNADFSKLYFADSETSSIRYVGMRLGDVATVVGNGLFDYGHKNGPLKKARLQHALGVAVMEDGSLAVADSYNAALRRIDLERETVSDLDEGFSCTDSICLPYGEPAGIWADGKTRLLVSDTNNHRIVEIDAQAKTTRTWNKS